MSTTLGIYEPFKPYVRQQLEERRKILEEGGTNSQRNEEFYAYTVAKRCVITMISGVDLKDSAKDTFLEEDEKPKKTGNGLARQYILQGGTQHFDQDGNLAGSQVYIRGIMAPIFVSDSYSSIKNIMDNINCDDLCNDL